MNSYTKFYGGVHAAKSLSPHPSFPLQVCPHQWNVKCAWFRFTASFRTCTCSHISVYRDVPLNHNISSLVLNLFHNKLFLIQLCWFCLSISWVSIFYHHDWKLSFFEQNFQNKKFILILAPSLLSSHCCMQFFLEYTFPVMYSSKHHFSQGHNYRLSEVTDLFMSNSNKSSYKDSSFWWVLAKPVDLILRVHPDPVALSGVLGTRGNLSLHNPS